VNTFTTFEPHVARSTCFIVDDEPAICQFLSSTAAACDATPESFPSVKRLSAGLSKRTPGLIFLDISLEGSDAIDGIRVLAKSKFPGLVQLISGAEREFLEDVRVVGEQYSLRMLPPLSKPLDPATVKGVLGLLRSERDAAVPDAIDLKEALQHSWLEFWYQPKIDLRRKMLAGAELLARVKHPVHGVLGPHAFVPTADKHSLFRLTEHALHEALRAGVEYNEAGFNLCLAINAPVSALMQLRVPAIVREYHRVRDGWAGLILEVTEDEILEDLRSVHEIAIQLKLYGVQLSIDDFGHAYSSLARIKSLPVAELKIDSSFTSNCAGDQSNAALCQTVVDLAHRFGCLACAEGIETMEELRALQAMDCDYGQGFLLAAPMSKSQLIQALQQRTRQPRNAPPAAAPVSPPLQEASRHRPSFGHGFQRSDARDELTNDSKRKTSRIANT
jgi:EAL domain-containing protein (putative c-di-GMP-specific phosphodiesterase class I)